MPRDSHARFRDRDRLNELASVVRVVLVGILRSEADASPGIARKLLSPAALNGGSFGWYTPAVVIRHRRAVASA
jgi:hypothetical protein